MGTTLSLLGQETQHQMCQVGQPVPQFAGPSLTASTGPGTMRILALAQPSNVSP